MTPISQWILENQYWLRVIGHAFVLLGIVLTGVAGTRILRILESFGEKLYMLTLITIGLSLQILPFALGWLLYYINERFGILEFLIPNARQNTSAMSRGEAIWELMRWAPFFLICLYLTGGIVSLSSELHKKYRKLLAPFTNKIERIKATVAADRFLHGSGVAFAAAGVLMHLAVDANQ